MKTRTLLLIKLLFWSLGYANAQATQDTTKIIRSLIPLVTTPSSQVVDSSPKTAPIGRRCALVIGNNDYVSVSKLMNAVNDADDISASLKRIRFEVTTLKNVTTDNLVKALSTFKSNTKDAEIILIYYAGHGMSYDGLSYLLPVNIPNTKCSEEMLKSSISTNMMLEGLDDRPNQVKLIFLDACRNKLALTSCEQTPPKLSAQLKNNTAIVYAADDGNTANDGTSRNGLFTGCFLKYVEMPNQEVRDIIASTIQEASQISANKQLPNNYNSITFKVFLNPIPLSHDEVVEILKQSDNAYDQNKYVEAFKLLSPYVNHSLFSTSHARKLGYLYETGYGSTKSEIEALKYYTKAAHNEDVYSQFCLGWFYEKGIGVTPNNEIAKEWYKKAANQKGTILEPYALYNLGLLTEKEGKEEDAIQWYLHAAELDFVDAQVNLGVCYELGKGTVLNINEAIKWYKKAADQDDKDGVYNYARLNAGAISSNELAILYQKAAEKGHTEACINLGICYEIGKGIPIDYEKAKYWYELAASKNHPLAWFNLGCLAELTANNHQPNYVEAINKYEKAGKQNVAEAWHNLGIIYEKGFNGKKDMQKAKEYYHKAADIGYQNAQKHLKNLEAIGR